jgi:hypothetical protein
LITAGVILVLLGLAVIALGKLHLPLGRLPGDIVWRNKSTTVYIPIVTCLLLSIIGSVLLWFFGRRH